MKQIVISKLKRGDLFYLRPLDSSTLYVRDHYDRQLKRYVYHKYYDSNCESSCKPSKLVYV